jgi:hypothetical protein
MVDALDGLPKGSGEMVYDLNIIQQEGRTNCNEQQLARRSITTNILSYKGKWWKGEFSGFGTLTYGSGEIFQGGFLDNRLHGLGTIRYTDGSVFDGAFQLDAILGKGRMIYPDGSVYWGFLAPTTAPPSGTDSNNRTPTDRPFPGLAPHGRGKLTFADGRTIYDGEFSNGRMEGHGKLTSGDGSWYLGEFSDGEKNGLGLEVRADGTIYHEGVFCGGRKVVCSSVPRNRRCIGRLLLYRTSYSTGSRHALVGPLPSRIFQRCHRNSPLI